MAFSSSVVKASPFFGVKLLTVMLLLAISAAVSADKLPYGLTADDWNIIRTQMAGEPLFGQQAYFKASNTGVTDNFGHSVAVSGDTVVVGAWREDSSTSGVNSAPDDLSDSSGAAYVFKRSGSTWVQQAYLKASNPEANDRFGWSVAISGATIVVGAWAESSSTTGVNSSPDNTAAEAGAAYVFRRGGGMWAQEAYLKASNTDADDEFGTSVAISGDTIVVGAPREDGGATGVNGPSDENASASGAAYVFKRSGGVWAQEAYLKASNTGAGDDFGFSVSISGDTIVVGARNEDTSVGGVNPPQDSLADLSGAAYVFQRSGGQWAQQAFLKASNPGGGDRFATSVGISGDTIVAGANREDSSTGEVDGTPDDAASEAGAAYVFNRSGGTWMQQAFLKPSNIGQGDEFGEFVAISGDTVVVGARKEDGSATGVDGGDDNAANVAGAAYTFTRSGGTWTQNAYLKASNTGSSDGFGSAVAVSGDTVIVGALNERSNATGINGDEDNNSAAGAGAAYVFIDTSDIAINAGHAGAWFNSDTPGQGLFADIEPASRFMFLSWFTYTDAQSDNPGEQQWYTAQGNFEGNEAELVVFETLGGRFDGPRAVETQAVGTANAVFHDCESGDLLYEFDDGRQGIIPLNRVVPGSQDTCEDLDAASLHALDINPGMDGAWFKKATAGQGWFMDVYAANRFIFVSWFTYGDDTASGQRWLTAQGNYEDSNAEIPVFETTGGLFDDPQAVSTIQVGTMTIDFEDCSKASLAWTLTDTGIEGDAEITRVVPGTEDLCDDLTAAE